jgi:hypothetical protein
MTATGPCLWSRAVRVGRCQIATQTKFYTVCGAIFGRQKAIKTPSNGRLCWLAYGVYYKQREPVT